MPTASEEIKRLVRESGLPVKTVAEKAGVRYQPLQRFMQGINPRYNLVSAEAVFFLLTGKPLVPASAKPSRKRRAA